MTPILRGRLPGPPLIARPVLIRAAEMLAGAIGPGAAPPATLAQPIARDVIRYWRPGDALRDYDIKQALRLEAVTRVPGSVNMTVKVYDTAPASGCHFELQDLVSIVAR